MTFLWPSMLFLLVAAPGMAALYLYVRARRRRAAASFVTGGSGAAAAGRAAQVGRHLSPWLFMGGFTVLLFALARPHAVVSLPKVEGAVILVFDVSGSMLADDLKPTRLEAAKSAAREFVENQPASVQIGVVSFSEGGFSVQKPTNDKEAVLAAIGRLAAARGTSLGSGILVALNTIEAEKAAQPPSQYSIRTPQPSPTPTAMPPGSYASSVIVLLTDGENTAPPDPLEVARAAAERGVRVHTVGIGSPAGVILTVNGFTVHTQLDEAMLQQIAQTTGGSYYNAGNEADLESIYRNLDLQLVIEPEKMEVTSLFAGAGILIFLVGAAFSLLWNGRFL